MRVVPDTNVIVSGLISPDGPSAQIIARWLDEAFTLLHTPAMLIELEDVLNRTWLHARLASLPEHIPDLLSAVRTLGELVTGYVNVAGLVRDPFDEMFLACATLGEADYIVSVDRDLLSLGWHGRAKIITPAQLLAALDADNR